jgi:glycosyltransferase involved in cell wall biosynthesis
VLSEAKAMGLQGHQVVIAAPGKSQLAKLAKQEGIHCEAIPVGISGWGRLVPLFLRLFVKHKIQIVHTHGSQDSWTASLAGRLSSYRPVIVRTRHKSTPVSVSFRHDVLYRFLPHVVTTTGEAVRRQLIEQNRLNPDAVVSIPTGVDMKRFHSGSSDGALKEALDIQVGQPVVGTVSFLRPEKGLDVLIDAVSLLQKEFSQVCCLIVGTGQEHQKLLEQIRQKKLDGVVVFAGFREDIPELLNAMDVFVLPSFEEGMPQSLLPYSRRWLWNEPWLLLLWGECQKSFRMDKQDCWSLHGILSRSPKKLERYFVIPIKEKYWGKLGVGLLNRTIQWKPW